MFAHGKAGKTNTDRDRARDDWATRAGAQRSNVRRLQ